MNDTSTPEIKGGASVDCESVNKRQKKEKEIYIHVQTLNDDQLSQENKNKRKHENKNVSLNVGNNNNSSRTLNIKYKGLNHKRKHQSHESLNCGFFVCLYLQLRLGGMEMNEIDYHNYCNEHYVDNKYKPNMIQDVLSKSNSIFK